VQLPPTLAFDADRDTAFLQRLRSAYDGMVAWEPRHPSWSADGPLGLLAEHGITPVRTEIPAPGAAHPTGGTYVRLHGTPHRYYSAYSAEDLGDLVDWLAGATHPRIVVFDNTASPAGVRNARALQDLVAETS
jgi:uncharacterized protein YecE (DUF72 family)